LGPTHPALGEKVWIGVKVWKVWIGVTVWKALEVQNESWSSSQAARNPTGAGRGALLVVTKGRSTQLPALQGFFFEVSNTVFSRAFSLKSLTPFFQTICLSVTSNGIWLWVGINIGKPSGLLETYLRGLWMGK